MHGRTFHALCALAFALTAAVGLVASWAWPGHSRSGGLLLALLLATGFSVAAWMEPEPARLCGSCGGPRGEGFGFCVTCGEPASRAEARA